MNFKIPNLKRLAGFQDILDKHVEEKHGITEDMTDETIIGFKVEFGEFLNEHKFFKYWSVDRTPNTHKMDIIFPHGIKQHGPTTEIRNPLLEEFVDGIHFLLSIGNKRKYIKHIHALEAVEFDSEPTLKTLALDIFDNPISSTGQWLDCMIKYLYFGHLSGITADVIEEAYMEKNRTNHLRQENGY